MQPNGQVLNRSYEGNQIQAKLHNAQLGLGTSGTGKLNTKINISRYFLSF